MHGKSKSGHEFIKHTPWQTMLTSDQTKDIHCPDFMFSTDDVLQVIELPEPMNVPTKELTFRQAANNRQSIRKYADTPLSLAELSYLLWATQGIKKVTAEKTLRTVPSAGSRHPFETYLVINNIASLEPGLYRYLPFQHQLGYLGTSPEFQTMFKKACIKGPFVDNSAVTFIWVAVPYRMTWRHGERGYRYLFLDAGHVCQNLYLAVEDIGAGACAIGVFDDDALNALLRIDGVEHFVIYLAAVGKR
ncbi:MAG: SagB/ThcOx family dehydrogenase [bacterium]